LNTFFFSWKEKNEETSFSARLVSLQLSLQRRPPMNRKGIVLFDGIRCGLISEADHGFEFKYDEAWLLNESAQPISLTLPLQKETFFSGTFFSFFDGLVPEGWLLGIATVNWKVDSHDRMGLLLLACRDPIGAVSVIPFKGESNG
jgi:serine/threonine-protein kinase HipA